MTDPAPLAPTLDAVARALSAHLPVYRLRPPVYQTAMLASLRALWVPGPRRLLDVGGGTGVIAQAVQDLFPVDAVVSVDVEDRWLPSLSVECRLFDGAVLPFADGAFEAAMLNNVLHHVPVAARPGLLREVRRVVGGGPVYVKDHLATGGLDHLRLAALDLIGNVPFGGMVSADYLCAGDWADLAAAAGFVEEARMSGVYRSGLMAAAFPNALEVSMRWRTAG